MTARLVALTGASGFLGGHVMAALNARGLRVRALTRRPLTIDAELVYGSLTDDDALARLVAGADVVVHLAGLVKARARAEFFATNAGAAGRLADITRREAPDARFVLVSSLAAREPGLSHYAASKRAGEEAVRGVYGEAGLMLRPPALYGPGDREGLTVFKAARLPWVPVTGRGHVAMMFGPDAAQAITAAALTPTCTGCYALADERPEGYEIAAILRAAAHAQGCWPRALLPVPALVLRVAARINGALAALRGQPAMFTAEKAREMLHPDWHVSPAELLPRAIYTPHTSLAAGFAQTVSWYRMRGWLA
jgi:nucleoside-diphosphate-sugar epimerase